MIPFDVKSPLSSDYFSQIFTVIRSIKQQFKERFSLDHNMNDILDTALPTADGYHNQLTMPEYIEYDNMGSQSYVPVHLTDSNQLFVKKIDGLHELCVSNDDGVYQITRNNSIAYKSYKIGDTGPAGGIVFYDKGYESDGWRYIECSTVDMAKEYWSNIKTVSCGASATAIGTGLSNSNTIINQSGHTNSIAKKCRDYNGGGFNDWFLGSKEEMEQVRLQKSILGISRSYFISSSEVNAMNYWLYGNNWYSSSKDSMGEERAIRYFKSTVKYDKIG